MKQTITEKYIRRQKRRQFLIKILIHVLLLLGCVIMLTPLSWTLSTALGPNTLIPPIDLLPKEVQFDNFKGAWEYPSAFTPFKMLNYEKNPDFGELFKNTLNVNGWERLGKQLPKYFNGQTDKSLGEIIKKAMDRKSSETTFGEWLLLTIKGGNKLTLGTFIINSLISTVLITIGGIIFDSLAAYVLAFKSFPGKNLFIFLAFATLMIPTYITIVPAYLIVRDLGWYNSYAALVVPFLGSGMGISLFRSHFLGVSKELEECAKIDGAKNIRIYATIIMPIAKPIIGTMVILKAMWSWNQYLWPLIVTSDLDMKTIQVGIAWFRGTMVTQWGYLCAAVLIAILPLIIVFLCAQKQFIGGLQAGAVKG